MEFIHNDKQFSDLIRIVAANQKFPEALVEKDYWVTHVLWALHRSGLEIWFKGGTSLSKGFGLITRFSEDLDLKIEQGGEIHLPKVSNWRSEGSTAIRERKEFFEQLAKQINILETTVELDVGSNDGRWKH